MSVPEPSAELLRRAQSVRRGASSLSQLPDSARVEAVMAMARGLDVAREAILQANEADMAAAGSDGLEPALVARLKLDGAKLKGAIAGVRKVAHLRDPLGRQLLRRELSDGLVLEQVSVPLGVLGVIFEARPDAVMQIASLAVRSGNGVILKGGKEAVRSCRAIVAALKDGLRSTAVSADCLELLTTREESLGMLRLDGLVDLIIPRGSNSFARRTFRRTMDRGDCRCMFIAGLRATFISLSRTVLRGSRRQVRFVQDNTRIPVLGHAAGICHLYVDAKVDVPMAVRVAVDSKVQYPAACNAIETLLLHRDVAAAFLAEALPQFTARGVELRGDTSAQELGVTKAATDDDWSAEYSDLILAIRVVADLDDAITHIRCYGSRHTDVICSSDPAATDRFLSSVDSAGVYHNCSSRFADGYRYGFGAEVGISTQTLHPRGPVGLEGLVTYRYHLHGNGHTAADFAAGRTTFTHKELPPTTL